MMACDLDSAGRAFPESPQEDRPMAKNFVTLLAPFVPRADLRSARGAEPAERPAISSPNEEPGRRPAAIVRRAE